MATMDAMFELSELQQRQARWMQEFVKNRSYRRSGNARAYYRCDFCGVQVAEADWASHCNAEHHIANTRSVKVTKIKP